MPRGAIHVFGPADQPSFEQLARCQAIEEWAPAVLCADHHLGYSMPIGGVVGYEAHISPSAVGYDIACGNMAVRTDARAKDVNVAAVMDDVWKTISFGVGRRNAERVEHGVIDEIGASPVPFQRGLKELAAQQLGTVGSGNHYVDLFEDQADGALWVGVHFGSRGLGHKTATWALEQASNGQHNDSMFAPPVVIPLSSPLGEDYIAAMQIAGAYAYAGREWVVDRVLRIIGAQALDAVHNHHNFAWLETHGGRPLWVHRKGATPAFPGQRGFVGGTMGEPAVILEGVETPGSALALFSTVHGAGRARSRMRARKGRHEWVCPQTECAVRFEPPQVPPPKDLKCPAHRTQLQKRQLEPPINYRTVQDEIRAAGIELRGGGADEAPACYKRLSEVLAHHAETVRVLHWLRPIGVAMAGVDTVDPYKD